ncbi:proline-rich proteoglycan 2-like isoform X2 [Dermacentor silvarum]|uniref:proline-rich proteoglycan 2-like isoform X1 n=1 Tax=Dermacentor silvarum TaxID=543639 RepID=UPI00210177F5|nr:proline-rich proteoglycan 2-like isoform X1 [Dermacentor silvarum]XP_049526503.1 proline-rich proteoglycan 2-like isoform X2 [Dermacentor silvarum]
MRTLFFTFLTYYAIVCFVPRDGKAASSSRGCLKMPTEDDDCESPTDKWYYNQQEGTCANFMYGDCPAEGNKFDSKEECQNTCKNAGAGQHKGDPGSGAVKGSRGRQRPSRPSDSSQENAGRGPRRRGKQGSEEGEPGGHQGGRRPSKFGGSTGGHNRPTHQIPIRRKKPAGGQRRRPPQGSEENDTGTSSESVKGHGGNRRPPMPSGPYRPKPPKRTRPNYPRPGGGTKHRPPPPQRGPTHATCAARLRRGNCDDNEGMWFNDGAFFTCARVPPGNCPTVGSFFESCEECMRKCRPHQLRTCQYKT